LFRKKVQHVNTLVTWLTFFKATALLFEISNFKLVLNSLGIFKKIKIAYLASELNT